MNRSLVTLLLGAFPVCAFPETVAAPASGAGHFSPNPFAISVFLLFVCITLGITHWAARRNRTVKDFYTAGGAISGFQNGLAMAGDYISAGSFLGVSGMIFTFGFDGLIYSIGFLVGWPFVMFLIAEPLRNLGKVSFVDVVALRFAQGPIRTLTAFTTLALLLFVLISQMVGAGKLIELLFGLPYWVAECVIGALIVTYVSFGGMRATTWVQIIKAVLLLFGATFMAIVAFAHFGYSPNEMFRRAVTAHPDANAIMGPGKLLHAPLNVLSLGIALMFGTAGLPYVLMRFFTVPNAKEARRSVVFAVGFIGYFYLLLFIIGFAAIPLLAQHPEFFRTDASGAFTLTRDLLGGSNMVAVKLAQTVGGDLLYGFIAAVTFATILAVVAGVILSGAATVAHDLYANWLAGDRRDERREMRISRCSTVVLTLVGIGLGIAFEHINVAFVVGLFAAISASANFPVLVMSIYWRGMTTAGAVLGGGLGVTAALLLTLLSKSVWVNVLHQPHEIVSLDNPAIISVPLAFAGIWLGSVFDRSLRGQRERASYPQHEFYAQTGVLAQKPVEH